MINLSHVAFTYEQNQPFSQMALSDISLRIDRGEMVGVIGHTGSGKSTLMQILCGLLPASQGTVTVCGKDLTHSKTPAADIRGRVGLVFQYPEHQLFEETVEKDITFGAKNVGVSDGEVAVRVQEVVKLTGLSNDLLECSPFELSGGQKRRVAIAGVLAMHPEILILDEPAAGLDPVGRKEIFESICTYQEKYGATVLFVSHSMEDVAAIAKRVLVLHQGSLVMDGPTEEIYAKVEELHSYRLDVPKINQIMTGLESRGLPVRSDILTVLQAVAELSRIFRRDGS